MAWLNVVLLVYGIISIALGLQGFINKGSLPSLVAGGIAGMIIIASVALAKTHPRPARITAAVISLLLLGRFLPKVLNGTGHVSPDIIMSVSSAIVFVCLLGAHFYAKSKADKAKEVTGDQ